MRDNTPGEGEREGSEVGLKILVSRWLRTELKKLVAHYEQEENQRVSMSQRVKELIEFDVAIFAKTGKVLNLTEAQHLLLQYHPDKHTFSKFALKVQNHYASLVEKGFHPVRLQQLADGEEPTLEEITQVDKALKTLPGELIENGI